MPQEFVILEDDENGLPTISGQIKRSGNTIYAVDGNRLVSICDIPDDSTGALSL